MKLSKIEEIIELYKSLFPVNWLDSYDWSAGNEEVSYDKALERIVSFDQDVFFLFSQSVLAGEYIPRLHIPKELDALYDLLNSGELYDDERNSYRSLVISKFNELSYSLGEFARRYRYLLTILERKYSIRQNQYVVNAYRQNHANSNGSLFGDYYNALFDITHTDHLLRSDHKTITSLILHQSLLAKGIDSPTLLPKNKLALRILNEKCLFLMKKLLIEDNKEFDYLIDFEIKHYDATSLNFSYIAKHDEAFEFYRSESYSNNDSYGLSLDRQAYSGKMYIGKYALLMKFYKDSKGTDESQIEHIIKDFNDFYTFLTDQFYKRPFDKYALNTLKNYMYNSRLSYRMKTPDYTFEMMKGDIKEVMSIQKKTGILNFYPYRKAIGYILFQFEKNKQLPEEELKNLKSLLDECITKFSESIEWCHAMNFYPIQSLFRECLTVVHDFGAVFVASSFCRPIRYHKLKDELNVYKNRALYIDNEIEVRKEKFELANIKRDIDNSRTREIEVLSFFTAIITFIFGTIGFFAESKNSDFLHLVYSIFGLGAILLIFVSGIHLVTVRKEENALDYFKHPRAWFCIATILSSVALLIWLIVNIKVLSA